MQKLFAQGIAGKSLIDYTHWKSNEFPEEKIMAQIENPMRHFLDKIIESLKQKFLLECISVNCLTVPSGIIDIFIGDFYSSYRKAAKLSYKFFVKKIKPCSKMLVILDDKCLDFWQAAKAVYNCARIIKNGGFIVVRGKLKEGISPIHRKIVEKFGYSNPLKIQKLVESGEIKDIVVASHMIRIGQHLERIKIFLSSEYLTKKVCKKVNLGYMSFEEIKEIEFDYVIHNPVDVVLQEK